MRCCLIAIEHARNDKSLTREDLAERIRKSERPSFYERAIRIVSRAERELAGSFYVNLDQGMDLKTSIEAQKTGREVLDKLGQIKAELAAMRQEFTNEMECGQDQTSGMSMEL